MNKPFLLLIPTFLLSCGRSPEFEVRNLVRYVDTRYGTENPGNTVIGPQLPWGSINPSPDTEDGRTDGYADRMPIRGFSQLHVSGTGGLSRYGNILVSPQTGLETRLDRHDSPKSGEITRAGYYRVCLDRYKIITEITPAHHSALYRFTFPESDSSHIVFDLFHCIPNQRNPDAGFRKGEISIERGNYGVSGWAEYEGGWGGWTRYKVYFTVRFSTRPVSVGTWKNEKSGPDSLSVGSEVSLEHIGAYARFATTANGEILMKIGISMTSIEQAGSLLEKEIPDFDFELVREKAEDKWNRVLSTILVDDPGVSEDELLKFYSNYYHCFVMPRDRTRDNPYGWNGPYWDDQYCGWDTYRTLFPLLTLVRESFIRKNIQSFQLRHQKLEPYVSDAFIAGRNHRVQGGDNVDVVIADAFVKSVEGIDWKEAYSIMKFHADSARQPDYLEGDRGYVFAGSHRHATSVSLELSYNDYCIARVAEGLGKMADFERYESRSHNWEKLWNPDLESDGFSGYINPKFEDGSWYPGLDLKRRGGQTFYEGRPWGYSYDLPHDIGRLIVLMGGKEGFTGRTIHYFDSGLHDWSNEPCFLMSHLFHYVDRPDLSLTYTRMGLAQFTMRNSPGNDDSGAMGSWYVLNAIGLFPVAGQDIYLLHNPLFRRITIQLENGSRILISTENPDPDSFEGTSIALNGNILDTPDLKHSDLRQGAVLEFRVNPR